MRQHGTLEAYLERWAENDAQAAAVARTVTVLAQVAARVAVRITKGPLDGSLDHVVGDNTDGDAQKALDVLADEWFLEALREAPVAYYASEEQPEPVELDPGARLAVAIDPLDGSSNIDTNVSIGTIFAVLPADGAPETLFTQPGSAQLAAGFVVYGPQTALALTVRAGTQIFTLDPKSERFLLTRSDVRIPAGRREYAINASNYRHWDFAIRAYVDDCTAGVEGPRGGNFNMRWIASLVAEAYRILVRGGVFLYPADRRPGYENGRLRLVYEARPIALVIADAGGAASNGELAILELEASDLHQRVPLVFGAADKVQRIAGYYEDLPSTSERSPLFGRRSLFHHS